MEPQNGSYRYSFTDIEIEEYGFSSAHTAVVIGKKPPTMVGNFLLYAYPKRFYFSTGSNNTWFVVIMRRQYSVNGADIYLAMDDKRSEVVVSDTRYLDVEMSLNWAKLKTNRDLREAVMDIHPAFIVTNLTLDMLSEWMSMEEYKNPPKMVRIIEYFGKQPKEESGCLHVSGNVCWRVDGFYKLEFLSHIDADIYIFPKVFTDSQMPVAKVDWPQHILIAQEWVRYAVLCLLWNNHMKSFFGSNELNAKATFAAAVMGLYADQIWGGQSGVGHGVTFTWVWSVEPGTGKTEALMLCNSFLGFDKRGVWAGDSTQPAIMERLSQQSGRSVCIDDVVIKGPDSESVRMSKLGRCVYDCTSRSVFNRIRKPLSSLICSVRHELPPLPAPAAQRSAPERARSPASPFLPLVHRAPFQPGVPRRLHVLLCPKDRLVSHLSLPPRRRRSLRRH